VRPTLHDHDVTTASPAVAEGLERFAADFLGARDDAAAIMDLAREHPECALVQAYAAALSLYGQSRTEIERTALPLLERASALRAGISARESLLIDALLAWARNDHQTAIALLERIAADWPRDVVAAKFAEFLFYEAPDYRRHLRFMERIAAANDDVPAFLAMHAFAHELCRGYERAESLARRAIDLDPYTPWAHHALAHLFLNQRRVEEGLALLRDVAPTWDGNTQATRSHNWWHVALLHLANEDADDALQIYRERIAGFAPSSAFEHVDAISLLWRAELAGHRHGDEWRVLAPHLLERAQEQIFPFLNAHYVYALTRAGHEDVVEDALDRLRDHALRQTGAAARVFRDVGLPLVTACAAFAAGEASRCTVLLEPILPEVACVGGSDAQNDLFRQTYLVALLDSGRQSDARRRLNVRLDGHAPTAVEQRWLARA
jgi:tetratricopeptide (TPR) repeat protein